MAELFISGDFFYSFVREVNRHQKHTRKDVEFILRLCQNDLEIQERRQIFRVLAKGIISKK